MEVDLKTIWELLTDVDGKCDDLLTFREVHEETHKYIDSHITDMHKTLYSKPLGLAHVVDGITANCKSHTADVLERKAFRSSLINKLTVAAIIALVGWLLLLYRSGGPKTAGGETPPPAASLKDEG